LEEFYSYCSKETFIPIVQKKRLFLLFKRNVPCAQISWFKYTCYDQQHLMIVAAQLMPSVQPIYILSEVRFDRLVVW